MVTLPFFRLLMSLTSSSKVVVDTQDLPGDLAVSFSGVSESQTAAGAGEQTGAQGVFDPLDALGSERAG